MRKRILPLLILMIPACGLTGPDRVRVNITGTVTSEATGQPIVGARVELEDPALDGNDKILASTTTDAQGRYSLSASVNDNCDIGILFGLYVVVNATGFSFDLDYLTECEGSFVYNFVLSPSP